MSLDPDKRHIPLRQNLSVSFSIQGAGENYFSLTMRPSSDDVTEDLIFLAVSWTGGQVAKLHQALVSCLHSPCMYVSRLTKSCVLYLFKTRTN